MENNTIFCKRCGAENRADYIFCKNCGATLNSNGANARVDAYVPSEYSAFAYYENENISNEQMKAFIGKNHISYINRFNDMKARNSKLSWHWPLFILTFLFGPVGASFWFFYRKMYKIAVPLFAIALILIGFDSYYNVYIPFFNAVKSGAYAELIHAILEDNSLIDAATENFTAFFNETNTVVTAANDLIKLVSAIVLPMFANAFYEKFTVNKIKRLIENGCSDNASVAKAGGVSKLWATLAPVIYYAAILIVSFVIITVTAAKYIG